MMMERRVIPQKAYQVIDKHEEDWLNVSVIIDPRINEVL